MAFTYKHGDRPLDGYLIQRAVGRGGFGEVYYAISDGGREVALKYLRENPEVELRGISQCINLKSPHLVSIFDVRQNVHGEYFVIMEYVSGPSLRDILISDPHGLGVDKAAFFVREIAKGLGYLHDQGIVHRDLKPGNIFYEDGYVKICDYGLSKFISVSRHSAQTASVGTVHYMAPEVGSGNYSKEIDIYALGVILYEMLMGKVPYEGSSMGEILMKHLTQQPEVDQLPQPFADVIRKALAKDPQERYSTVHEMVQAIFQVEEIERSVSGFEPASLTVAAARAMADVRPSPTPVQKPAPLAETLAQPRGRRVERGSSDFSRQFVERTVGLDAWMTKQERRSAQRQRRKDKLLGKDDDKTTVIRSKYHVGVGRRVARVISALIVSVGVSVALGIIAHDSEFIPGVLVSILAGTLGIGVGLKLASFLGPDHPWFVGRLMIVACGSVAAILPASFVEGGYIPVLAMLAINDWSLRVRKAQRGQFEFWDALMVGFVGFIAAAIGISGFEWFFGFAGAGWSISVQTFAWALIRNPLVNPNIEQYSGEDLMMSQGIAAKGVGLAPQRLSNREGRLKQDWHSREHPATEPGKVLAVSQTAPPWLFWLMIGVCVLGAMLLLGSVTVLGMR